LYACPDGQGEFARPPTDVVRLPHLTYNHGHVAEAVPAQRGERPVPELPEVETVVRDLRPLLVGRRLASVRVSKHALRRPWSKAWAPLLAGRRVEEVRRRGKWIVLALDGSSRLVFHLGMTGRLTVAPAGEPVADHTHLVIDLDGGGEQLRFRDVRRFGSATFFPDAGALEQFFEKAGLGPEPFDLDPRAWHEALRGTDRNLKAVLLDQRVVAGVGNIYADESLFEARLYPARPASGLSAAEAGRLRRAIATVLTRAVERRGSTIRDYLGGSGQRGGYQEEFRAYGRAGQPCRRCGTPIERVRIAGRSTHYCPRCQPPPV
jgi:formamidopyrimidine-DNA glycosylase